MGVLDYLLLLFLVFSLLVAFRSIQYFYYYKIPDFQIFVIASLFSAYYAFAQLVLTRLIPEIDFITPFIPQDLVYHANFTHRILLYVFLISTQMLSYLFTMYFLRSLLLRFNFWIYFLFSLPMMANLFIYSPVLLAVDQFFGLSNIFNVRVWIYSSVAIVYAILGIFVYKELANMTFSSTRLNHGSKLWKLSFLPTFLVVLSLLYTNLEVMKYGEGISADSLRMLTLTPAAILFLTIAIIAVKYPDALLIFRTHMIRFTKIYDKKISTENRIIDFKYIRDYISSVPKDYFD